MGGPAAASACFPLVPIKCGTDSESSPVGPLLGREKEGRENVESDSELNQGGWNGTGWGGEAQGGSGELEKYGEMVRLGSREAKV